MKTIFPSLLLLLILSSCSVLKNKDDNKFPAQVVVSTDEEIVITETFARYEDPNAVQVDKGEEHKTEKKEDIQIRQTEAQKKATEISPPKDTLFISENEVAVALESERVARNAHIWAFVPLLSLVFGIFAFLTGIIVTLILINKVKKMPFVTQKALDRIHKARRTLLWTTVGLVIGLLILLLVLLAVAIALL